MGNQKIYKEVLTPDRVTDGLSIMLVELNKLLVSSGAISAGAWPTAITTYLALHPGHIGETIAIVCANNMQSEH